jgi:uncharacterized protein YjbI with pentapeptide repeats
LRQSFAVSRAIWVSFGLARDFVFAFAVVLELDRVGFAGVGFAGAGFTGVAFTGVDFVGANFVALRDFVVRV